MPSTRAQSTHLAVETLNRNANLIKMLVTLIDPENHDLGIEVSFLYNTLSNELTEVRSNLGNELPLFERQMLELCVAASGLRDGISQVIDTDELPIESNNPYFYGDDCAGGFDFELPTRQMKGISCW